MKSLRFAPVWLALALTLAIAGLASASTGVPGTGNTWTLTQSPNPGG
jgi:ABC-type sulfate transport system permease component